MPDATRSRFVIEKVELLHESEGPDYFTSGEFRVTDTATGEIVARFPWSLEEAYLANSSYSGPDEVRISDDGTEAIAVDGRSETRVLLPVPWHALVFDGVELRADTDYHALAHRAAAEDGPLHPETRTREPGGQWLWKVYQRLGRTPQATALVEAIAGMLSGEGEHERAAALHFYYFLPDAPGSGQLLELLDTRRELFEGSLDAPLIRTLVRLLHGDSRSARTVELARREVFREGAREDLLRALVEQDTTWFLDKALAIARAANDRWKEVLYAAYAGDMDRVGAVARLLIENGVVSRKDALANVRERFRGYGLGEVEKHLAAR